MGNFALQYRRDTSVSRQNQPPLQISSTGLLALSYARCILKTCCSNNIRAIIEIRDLCKARHLPLPREPSQKNATRPDKPFNRYLGGMEGGATKFPTNVIGTTQLHRRCLQKSVHACMHGNWISVNNWLPIKENNLQAAFFSFHNCCKHAYLDMTKKVVQKKF